MEASAGGRVPDLSKNRNFYLQMADATYAWRQRLVTELKFGDRNHVHATSSYQIELSKETLAPFTDLDGVSAANVVLPLTTRSKQLLLNLGVAGPGGCPVTVTSRRRGAELETDYLVALANQMPPTEGRVEPGEIELWRAVCAFSPVYFRSNFGIRGNDIANSIRRYLSSALGFGISRSQVEAWREKTTVAGATLLAALGEPREPLSSSEEILLAIPELESLPRSVPALERIVDDYCATVEQARRAGNAELLSVLCEYGRRYELIVEVEVPVEQPCRIKLSEDLPLGLRRKPRGWWVEQTFALRDAPSAHLEARLADPNVEINGFDVRDLAGAESKGYLEGVRLTREALALYAHEPQRPHYVRLAIRLRVAQNLLAISIGLSLLNVIAIGFALGADPSSELAGRLAVIGIPTAIAAGFVLVREETALATRLQLLPRLTLALTAVALWVLVGVKLISGDGVPDPGTRNGSERKAQTQTHAGVTSTAPPNRGLHSPIWQKSEHGSKAGSA